MEKKFTFFVDPIVGTVWEPEGKTKAVVILCHGITDYHSRYEDFAKYLTDRGVAVIGFDYPGHGKSGGSPRVYFGKNGAHRLTRILRRAIHEAESRFRDTPVYLLGMSLGSYLVRSYLIQYEDDRIAGAILVGTGHMTPIELFIAKAITKIEEIIHGDKAAPKLIQTLAFEVYNREFEPVRTSMDWLIVDPEELDRFVNSPYRGQEVTVGAFRDLLDLASVACDEDDIKVGTKVPIFICSGACDAVGGFGDKADDVYTKFVEAGYKVNFKLYEDSRHDVLHDCDREEAYADIASWIAAREV